MPCMHVAVVYNGTGRGSSSISSGNTGFSCQHHAIFDQEMEEYIHVSRKGNNGNGGVVVEGRRSFESSGQPRVVKQPATVEEGRQILARARALAAGGAWDYRVLSHNCEHFVNECWNSGNPPQSTEARTAVRSLGGSGAVGAISGGIAGTITASVVTPIATTVTTTATETAYFLGFIPWGTVTTTTSATVMTGLPLGAVIGIGVGGTVVAGAAATGIAYGVREDIYAKKARNAQLVPITVYNRSDQAITASLQIKDSTLTDKFYRWRAFIGIGVMSVDIASNMAAQLNPPTVADSFDTDFELTVSQSHPFAKWSCTVQRGDIAILARGGRRLRLRTASRTVDLECCICRNSPPNIILRPCGHWEFCEQCILQIIGRNALCPLCQQGIQEYDVR